MADIPAIELPGSQTYGSGSGTKNGYTVEVRTSYHTPTVIDGFVIDAAWRRLPIREGGTPWSVNIPVKRWDRDLLEHGLLPWAVAEAHRWAFLAILEASQITGSLCIQTRIVKVEFKYEYAMREVGVTDPLCSDLKTWLGDGGKVSPRKVEE